MLNFDAQSAAFKSTDDCYKLNDGSRIPCLGFGTWQIRDAEHGEDVIAKAIAAGYRHFDAAAFYKSEKSVGAAIVKSGLKREDFFITSKVWRDDLSRDQARRSLTQSLHDLKTDYLDLLLIHWPKQNAADAAWQDKIAEVWQAFQDFRKEGLVRSIGTANFLPHHFAPLGAVLPSVNQIEYHAGYLQQEAVNYCKARGILVEAWAAVGRGALLTNPTVKALAAFHHISPAQLCLKFCLKNGVLPLVKGAQEEHMRQNRDLFSFELSAADMQALLSLPDKTAWSGEHPDF